MVEQRVRYVVAPAGLKAAELGNRALHDHADVARSVAHVAGYAVYEVIVTVQQITDPRGA